jgi:hypothetical protein
LLSPSGEATCPILDADPIEEVLAKCVVPLLGDNMSLLCTTQQHVPYSMLIPSIEVVEKGELPPSGEAFYLTLDADPSEEVLANRVLPHP